MKIESFLYIASPLLVAYLVFNQQKKKNVWSEICNNVKSLNIFMNES